jgi:Xaa-Pro aminopeptidase
LVTVDVGAWVDGYASDMTRTFSVGGPPSDPELRRVWDKVLESQQAGVRAVRAGVGAADVDRICRDIIDAAGWGDYFTHSTGHGVGLAVHEAPSVSARGTATLEVAQIVTVEPGIYLPRKGGVRIEDSIAVTDGEPDVLTLHSKELIVA